MWTCGYLSEKNAIKMISICFRLIKCIENGIASVLRWISGDKSRCPRNGPAWLPGAVFHPLPSSTLLLSPHIFKVLFIISLLVHHFLSPFSSIISGVITIEFHADLQSVPVLSPEWQSTANLSRSPGNADLSAILNFPFVVLARIPSLRFLFCFFFFSLLDRILICFLMWLEVAAAENIYFFKCPKNFSQS